MAVEVQMDMPGTRAWWDDNGFHCIRKGLVTGLDNVPVYARALSALVQPGTPFRGDALPWSGITGLTVRNMSSQMVKDRPDAYELDVEYGFPTFQDYTPTYDPDKADVAVSTVTVEVETQFDAAGAQIYTAHKKTEDPQPKEIKVPGSVRMFQPTTVITFRRIEPYSPGIIDESIGVSRTSFVGALNSESVFGDGARVWLCTEVSGESTQDKINSFSTRYSFARSPKRSGPGVPFGTILPWDPTIVEIDPNTGSMVLDPVNGEGVKTIQIQGEQDFHGLGFNF